METIGGLAVLISLAFFVNVIIRLYKHLRKVDGIDVKTTIKRVVIAVGLFIVGGAMLGTADDGAEVASSEINAKEEIKEEKEKPEPEKKEEKPKEGAKDKKAKGEKKKEAPKKEEKKVDVTSEKDIEKLVNGLLGDTSNTGEKRVEKVVYNEVDTSPYIGLNLHADENITVKLARSGMLKDTLEIMKALNKEGYKGKFYVDWRLPLTDKYGNTKPGKVMSINISAEDFGKINFDKVDYLNLPNIAESYYEHPGFSD